MPLSTFPQTKSKKIFVIYIVFRRAFAIIRVDK
nr:MAG TPA: hypothetical protein [Caudoviricetes sp.]